MPLSGQACQEPPGAQASWLGVPLADSQRGRERAHNLISVFVPDTNPNSSGCPNTPSIVSFLSRSPATASNSWAGSSRGGGRRPEGPRGSCSPHLSPLLNWGLWLLGKCSHSSPFHPLHQGCSGLKPDSVVARQSCSQNKIQSPHHGPGGPDPCSLAHLIPSVLLPSPLSCWPLCSFSSCQACVYLRAFALEVHASGQRFPVFA